MPVSQAFYQVLKNFINKDDNILEFGCSTGHISYRLAKEGYNVTLLDIRRDPVQIAAKNFKRHNVPAQFLCSDIFHLHTCFNFIWNSGLIQCFDDAGKEMLAKQLVRITDRLLLFYPDMGNQNKKRGLNRIETPGVNGAMEYDIKRVPEIFYDNFSELYIGLLNEKKVGLSYGVYWLYARNV
jgi:SAM-dependent methyltransferase